MSTSISVTVTVTVTVSATATDSHCQRRKGPGPEPRAKCPTFAEALRHHGSMGYAVLWTAPRGSQAWLTFTPLDPVSEAPPLSSI